jgi:hypothetical protein
VGVEVDEIGRQGHGAGTSVWKRLW